MTTLSKKKEQIFNSLLGYRMAMYKLMDLGLVRDDDIDHQESWFLRSAGLKEKE
mgnify:FL=1